MIGLNITNKRGMHSKRLFIFLSPTNKITQLNINHALLAVETYHRGIYFITLQVGKRKHTTLFVSMSSNGTGICSHVGGDIIFVTVHLIGHS